MEKRARLYEKMQRYLQLANNDVMYGTLETSQTMTQTCEQCRHYGVGFAFATISFADIYNTRSIQASI